MGSITRLFMWIICKIIIIQVIINSCSSSAQPYRNVSVGTSIFADDGVNSSSWLSPSAEFAFGFQQVSPGGYLLAIWFDKIPEKTIVWSANRDKLAPRGSRIQLRSDGSLQLIDPQGQQLWAVNQGRSAVAYAAMLDTGDFVLATTTSSILWRSFNETTDTLLPSQTMDPGVTLTCSFSEKNYSRGRFKLMMQSDGNLVLHTRNFPLEDSISAYWYTGTSGPDFSLVFNQSGSLYVVARNGSTVPSPLSSNVVSTSQFYQRLTLEYDGVLRHYVRPKFSNSTNGRPMEWSVYAFYPANICANFGQGATGENRDFRGGACGYNALCKMGDQRPQCSCPLGYSLVDPNDPIGGCKQDFVPQRCDEAAADSENFEFIEIADTDWPFSDYASLSSFTEDDCRQNCLADCYCDVAAHTEGNHCVKKNVPLSNGRLGYSSGIKALLKIRKKNGTSDGFSSIKNGRSRSGLITAVSVLLGSSAFLNLLLLAFITFLVYHRLNPRQSKKIGGGGAFPGMCITRFSFKELQESTNGFNEKLGAGACSTVYKGTLNKNVVVAVKKLDKIAETAEQEFKAEVSSISRTNHKNLVQLLGYCDEGENKLLVYEFMSNGSLADLLFGSSPKPNWYRRLQISFATARALCYLHEECTSQIIHCDIKPHNVLLDDNHTPKISDFGLAKLLRADQTRTTTGIRGTRGYMAPEWFRNMAITPKVDVYSFGVMLLELLCCRRSYEVELVEDEEQVILADWAYDCYKEGRLEAIVAGDEEAKNDIQLFEKLVMVAIWCIQEDPTLRPQMKRVMHMLEGSIQVPPPPNPTTFIN